MQAGPLSADNSSGLVPYVPDCHEDTTANRCDGWVGLDFWEVPAYTPPGNGSRRSDPEDLPGFSIVQVGRAGAPEGQGWGGAPEAGRGWGWTPVQGRLCGEGCARRAAAGPACGSAAASVGSPLKVRLRHLILNPAAAAPDGRL